MRRSIGWLVAAAVAAAPAAVAAEPADGLAWSATDRCGSIEALRARVEAHLGRPLAASDAIRAEVEVVSAPIEGDVRATVTIATRRGRAGREVHGADCAAVVDAVAYVIASTVSEGGEVAAPPDDGDPPRAFRSVPVVDAPPRRAEHLAVQVSVEGWSDAGTLPTLQLGVGGSLAVSRGRYRGEVGAASWDAGWRPLTSGNYGGGVSLRSAGLHACYGVGPWRLWLCGGVQQGTMHGEGAGGGTDQPYRAMSFQTMWTRPIGGPMRIAASIEGLANLARPAYGGPQFVQKPEAFSLRLGLGVGVVVW